MVVIVVEPSFERQVLEVIPYWEDHWEVKRQDLSRIKKDDCREVIPHQAWWSRSHEPITYHDITLLTIVLKLI